MCLSETSLYRLARDSSRDELEHLAALIAKGPPSLALLESPYGRNDTSISPEMPPYEAYLT